MGTHNEYPYYNVFIMKTGLYSFDPLKSHFFTLKLGFTLVYINFVPDGFLLQNEVNKENGFFFSSKKI